MSETVHERTVSASPAAVWKRLADFGHLSEWARAVDHSSLMTDQTEGVGASRRVQSGSTVLLESVVEWDPERALAYELVGLPAVARRVLNRWTLDSTGDGTTVRLTSVVSPGPRPPMRLAARVLSRRLAAINASLVDDLAAAVETRSGLNTPSKEPTP